MPFVRRDVTGQIVAASIDPQEGFTQVEPNAADFVEFEDRLHSGRSRLRESDLEVIRVLEDMIYLLMEKNTIRFTDLPEMAQRKLIERRNLRLSSNALSLLGEEFNIV